MGIVINTNTSSLSVQRSLSTATKGLSSSIEKLSSGYRINRAADDAAGLAISESLKSQKRGSEVASSNAQTGINLLQTAEGDLGIIQDNLQRIRDLTVQAGNGTNGSTERTAIKKEIDERLAEINRIANSSSFNTVKLLDGSSSKVAIQVGGGSSTATNQISIGSALGKATTDSLGSKGTVNDVTGVFTGNASTVQAACASYVAVLDAAITDVSNRRATIGALQNRFESAIDSLAVKYENMAASESRIRDVDVAKEAAVMTKNQILQQSAASLLASANQAPSVALTLI